MMKLYLGSRNIKPPGYQTVDLDTRYDPDIVADVTCLDMIDDGTADEVFASHILEHIAWPEAFKAMSEWTRVLKIGGILRIGVPDLGALSRMISSGINPWRAIGLIYGLGRRENVLEAHQFGYTSATLMSIMRTLGFADFNWWDSSLEGSAQSGWIRGEDDERIAISINVAGIKSGATVVDPDDLYKFLIDHVDQPFDSAVTELLSRTDSIIRTKSSDPLLLQRVHMKMIQYRQRALYLEEQMKKRPISES